MEYEKIGRYEEKKGKDKKSLIDGKLEFAIKAIDTQEFEMPRVCH